MPLVLSVYGLVGKEKNVATKILYYVLSAKLDRFYLATCGYVRDCLSINLLRDFIFIVWRPHIGETHIYKYSIVCIGGIKAGVTGGLNI